MKKKTDGMSFVLNLPLMLRAIVAAQGKAEGLVSQKSVTANLREILHFHPLDRRVNKEYTKRQLVMI